jgi:hypothetical protein
VPAAAALAVLLFAGTAAGQFRGVQAASVMPPAAVELQPGEDVVIPLRVVIRPGYHINSDTPAEDYMIPTRLTWSTAGLRVKSIDYPEPEIVNYEFSEKPLSVYSGSVTFRTTLAVAETIPSDLKEVAAKFRYQACTEKVCLPPVTLDVAVPVRAN